MKRCKHENADHLMPGDYLYDGAFEHAEPVGRASCEQLRCLDCGAWLSLGPSNDAPHCVRLEMRLAELLAQTECYWASCGAKDEQLDLYVDIFATDEPIQYLRKPGPRSPIEIMVDQACGFHPPTDSKGCG